MKKLCLLALAAAGSLALTSCSGDDDNNNNNVSAALTGTYELTSATAATAQDYDGDGDSSTNLVMEGGCYNDSWISFHEDGTYDESITSSTTGEGGLTLSCDTKISSGTYTQNGDTVTTNRISGEGSLTATYTFSASGHTLTRTQNNGTYSGWNAATSLWANLSGSLNMVFTKYTDNDNDNGNGQDDDDNTDSDGRAEVTGNFDLTAFIVATAQNLDHDADNSTNLVTETNCYGNSDITFHSDGTYEENTSSSILGSGGLSLSCDMETTTGTWTRNGDKVITRHASGNANVSTQYTLNAASHTLTRSGSNVDYPTFNAVNSLFATISGNVDYTYTKD